MEVKAWQILNLYNFFIAFVLYLFAKKGTSTNGKQTKAYCRILLLIMFLVLGDYLSRAFKGTESFIIFSKIGNYIVYSLDPLMGYFILEYVDTWIIEKAKCIHPIKKIVLIMFYCNISLVTISEIFDLHTFYYYEQAQYLRGDYFLCRALVMAIEFILVEFYILYRTKRYRLQEKTIIRFFLIPTLLLGLFQTMTYDLALEYSGIVAYTMILYIYVQSRNASVDFLTGLVNRRIFENELELKFAMEIPFSGVMIDVDHFKQINDHYGHQEGDKALTAISEIIHKSFRKSDIISRYGGDEFCILTDITEKNILENVIARFRTNLEEFNESNKLPYQISLSIGYEVFGEKFQTVSEFLSYLDEKMYVEKEEHHKNNHL